MQRPQGDEARKAEEAVLRETATALRLRADLRRDGCRYIEQMLAHRSRAAQQRDALGIEAADLVFYRLRKGFAAPRHEQQRSVSESGAHGRISRVIATRQVGNLRAVRESSLGDGDRRFDAGSAPQPSSSARRLGDRSIRRNLAVPQLSLTKRLFQLYYRGPGSCGIGTGGGIG